MRDTWKQDLTEYLKKLGLIPKDFTGKITINLSQGSIGDVEKTERLK
jgi:hypothetical protein